jgi:hypothetical protein
MACLIASTTHQDKEWSILRSFKMCVALQHTMFCLERHNFWHYALVVNHLNYYSVLYNLIVIYCTVDGQIKLGQK